MLDIQKKTNDLISILISKFNSQTKDMKNRIKINSIFAEFDQKTRNQLNEFIQMSQNRYKGVKSGNELQNIISNQKLIYNKLSDKILNDYFYCTEEIDVENKKLFKKGDIKKNNEINDIREKIKLDAKDYSKHEIKTRERLLKQVEKKRKSEKNKPRMQSRLDYVYVPRFNFDNKRLNQESPKSQDENEAENEENKSTISLNEKKKYCIYTIII